MCFPPIKGAPLRHYFTIDPYRRPAETSRSRGRKKRREGQRVWRVQAPLLGHSLLPWNWLPQDCRPLRAGPRWPYPWRDRANFLLDLLSWSQPPASSTFHRCPGGRSPARAKRALQTILGRVGLQILFLSVGLRLKCSVFLVISYWCKIWCFWSITLCLCS